MGIVKDFINHHKEKNQMRNKTCNDYIVRIDCALQKAYDLFQDTSAFIQPESETIWKEENHILLQEISQQDFSKLKRASKYKILLFKKNELLDLTYSLKQKINAHNNHSARVRISDAYNLIGNIEGQKLDAQQMMSIIKEVHNHLVIAGAGTGKTTTIIGKIKYLLSCEFCLPEDILVLSFTNASAAEMSERIHSETNCNISALTFHKLGLNIINKVNGIMPRITQINMKKFIKEQLQVNMSSASYLGLLTSYLLFNRIVYKSEFEFDTEAEYQEYLRLNPPTTINNETVKSYGEMDIANFLNKNGIEYIYEQPYEIDTRTSEYGQYKPDFYLPKYNIYIEYFGINRHGEVPSYFKGDNGMSATKRYQESMNWKRKMHKDNHTIMIECFAYEKFDGTLLDNLQNNLINNGITLVPKSNEELWKELSSEDSSMLDGLLELFETVINLIKSNGYDIDTVRKLNINNKHRSNNEIIISLVEPIYNEYCTYLKANDEIDFNDMINTATLFIREGKYKNSYKYVIVDEYQDISKARFSLLKALRQSNDFNLFCVGDDWQSIYRFAGSDIGFILNFEKYWGATETSKIETTYRFPQDLIEISGNFIMQNPAQIRKNIRGMAGSSAFALGDINGYTEKYAIKFMVNKLNNLPSNSTVFFLGRYSFDENVLKHTPELYCRYDNTCKMISVTYSKRPDLKMHFITAHKSKGLQADYVFIINNKNSKMGFPSKMQDAPILNLLLENYDMFPYGEERRLYYVALTRAKHKVYMVTVANQESTFALELKNQYSQELKSEPFQCPLCGGKLIKRSSKYGEFLGCSNYRLLDCRYTQNIYTSK